MNTFYNPESPKFDINIKSLNIPTTRKLSQAERFDEGIKLLANECDLVSLTFLFGNIVGFRFEDGSYIGVNRTFKEAGILREN